MLHLNQDKPRFSFLSHLLEYSGFLIASVAQRGSTHNPSKILCPESLNQQSIRILLIIIDYTPAPSSIALLP